MKNWSKPSGGGERLTERQRMPQEVHILGDIVLPILHYSVAPWESVCTDVFQRMLLASVAVDSPADAAVLHPELFGTSEQARKAFYRAAFSGQSPIGNSYRECPLNRPPTGVWDAVGPNSELGGSTDQPAKREAGWNVLWALCRHGNRANGRVL